MGVISSTTRKLSVARVIGLGYAFANAEYFFFRNSDVGGAIAPASSNLVITNCSFTGNTSPSGGAVYATGGTVSVVDSGRCKHGCAAVVLVM